jgi:hypothetical protein
MEHDPWSVTYQTMPTGHFLMPFGVAAIGGYKKKQKPPDEPPYDPPFPTV